MTTFADDFNRADSTNLGAGWVEVSGDWSIVSNQLSPGTAGGTILLRAATDAATDDNFAQTTIAATAAASQGVACRTNANLSTGYLWRNNGTSWDLFTLGTFTLLATYTAAAAPGDVMKVQAVGSTIKGYVNGVERASVTDTTYATGKSSGIRAESTSALRFDDFSSGDVGGGSTVNGTISQAYGGLGGGITAIREVPASVAQAYAGLSGGVSGTREAIGGVSQALGGLSGGVSGTREVPGTAGQAYGGLGGGAAGTRETFAAVDFAGGGFTGHLTASTDSEVHANATTVALAWLRTLPGLPVGTDGSKQVAATLPHVGKWAGTGFVTVGPIFPGAPERYVPLQHPVVQFDFWAVHANSKKPNFSVANNLAEIVRAAAESNMWSDPPELTLPPGVPPVWISGIDVVRGIVNVPDENYAHYTMDIHIGWIERDALAGVSG